VKYYAGNYSNKQVQTMASYGEWIVGLAPWQLYVTLTFPFAISRSGGDSLFHSFIDSLENEYQATVAYVRCDELRYSGLGRPGTPLHFHCLLTSESRLSSPSVEHAWIRLVNRNHNEIVERRDRPARAITYDPAKGASFYLVKDLHSDSFEWRLSEHLGLYGAQIPKRMASCSRGRRAWRRSQQRRAALN
jgi:hypothetical protein